MLYTKNVMVIPATKQEQVNEPKTTAKGLNGAEKKSGTKTNIIRSSIINPGLNHHNR